MALDEKTASAAAEKVLQRLKSEGIFDSFRKQCAASIEDDDQFVKLRTKVEHFVESSLSSLTWPTKKSAPQLQNQLRSELTNAAIVRDVTPLVSRMVASLEEEFSERIRSVSDRVLQGMYLSQDELDDAEAEMARLDAEERSREEEEEKERRKKMKEQRLAAEADAEAESEKLKQEEEGEAAAVAVAAPGFEKNGENGEQKSPEQPIEMVEAMVEQKAVAVVRDGGKDATSTAMVVEEGGKDTASTAMVGDETAVGLVVDTHLLPAQTPAQQQPESSADQAGVELDESLRSSPTVEPEPNSSSPAVAGPVPALPSLPSPRSAPSSADVALEVAGAAASPAVSSSVPASSTPADADAAAADAAVSLAKDSLPAVGSKLASYGKAPLTDAARRTGATGLEGGDRVNSNGLDHKPCAAQAAPVSPQPPTRSVGMQTAVPHHELGPSPPAAAVSTLQPAVVAPRAEAPGSAPGRPDLLCPAPRKMASTAGTPEATAAAGASTSPLAHSRGAENLLAPVQTRGESTAAAAGGGVCSPVAENRPVTPPAGSELSDTSTAVPAVEALPPQAPEAAAPQQRPPPALGSHAGPSLPAPSVKADQDAVRELLAGKTESASRRSNPVLTLRKVVTSPERQPLPAPVVKPVAAPPAAAASSHGQAASGGSGDGGKEEVPLVALRDGVQRSTADDAMRCPRRPVSDVDEEVCDLLADGARAANDPPPAIVASGGEGRGERPCRDGGDDNDEEDDDDDDDDVSSVHTSDLSSFDSCLSDTPSSSAVSSRTASPAPPLSSSASVAVATKQRRQQQQPRQEVRKPSPIPNLLRAPTKRKRDRRHPSARIKVPRRSAAAKPAPAVAVSGERRLRKRSSSRLSDDDGAGGSGVVVATAAVRRPRRSSKPTRRYSPSDSMLSSAAAVATVTTGDEARQGATAAAAAAAAAAATVAAVASDNGAASTPPPQPPTTGAAKTSARAVHTTSSTPAVPAAATAAVATPAKQEVVTQVHVSPLKNKELATLTPTRSPSPRRATSATISTPTSAVSTPTPVSERRRRRSSSGAGVSPTAKRLRTRPAGDPDQVVPSSPSSTTTTSAVATGSPSKGSPVRTSARLNTRRGSSS